MTELGPSRRAAKVREILRARMDQRKQELPKRERERERKLSDKRYFDKSTFYTVN